MGPAVLFCLVILNLTLGGTMCLNRPKIIQRHPVADGKS